MKTQSDIFEFDRAPASTTRPASDKGTYASGWIASENLLLTSAHALSADILLAYRDVSWSGPVGRAPLAHFLREKGAEVQSIPVRKVGLRAKRRAKNAALEERIRKLEAMTSLLLAEQEQARGDEALDAPDGGEDEVVIQPHHKWIEAHRDVLRQYADSFVALDPERGIIAHSEDGEALDAQIDKLPAEDRDRLVVFHASMYLR